MRPLSRFAFHFQFRPRLSKRILNLRNDRLFILANHVRVDRLRDWRAVGVAECLLTQILRSPEAIHWSCGGMQGSDYGEALGYQAPEAGG